MRDQRGSQEKTLSRYGNVIEGVLEDLGADPSLYDAASIRAFISARPKGKSRPAVKEVVSIMTGVFTLPDCSWKVPDGNGRCCADVRHVASICVAALLPSADVERVIAACNLDTAVGLRDRAAILLLARLGLRAGDILNMNLVTLIGCMPVSACQGNPDGSKAPSHTRGGRAVLEYLRRGVRPFTDSHLFVTMQAPVGTASYQLCVGNRSACDRSRRRRDSVPRRARAEAFRGDGDVATGSHAPAGWSRTSSSVSRHHRALRQGRRTASTEYRSSMAGGVPMLSRLVDSYLELRRSTGYPNEGAGVSAPRLRLLCCRAGRDPYPYTHGDRVGSRSTIGGTACQRLGILTGVCSVCPSRRCGS